MSVSLWVGDSAREVGSASFFHAFFSTISYHLEPDGWGTRYPEIMQDLYHGELRADDAAKVHADILAIRTELQLYSPDQVIWDIENLDAKPPWGRNSSPRISDLANYFWTSDGKDLFDVLLQSLDDLRTHGGALRIE
jgi:hypothetical protein